MASTPTKLMTFAEFEQLPDPPEGYRQELRHGESVIMAPPKIDHSRVQWRIRRLLERAAADAGVVTNEIGFRAADDNNYRIADVAYVSQQRWDAAKDYLIGAPEIVVEVISPSNSAAEVNEKEAFYLANGCREFWMVDPKLQIVRVASPDGHGVTYHAGQSIPVVTLNGASIALNEIFPRS